MRMRMFFFTDGMESEDKHGDGWEYGWWHVEFGGDEDQQWRWMERMIVKWGLKLCVILIWWKWLKWLKWLNAVSMVNMHEHELDESADMIANVKERTPPRLVTTCWWHDKTAWCTTFKEPGHQHSEVFIHPSHELSGLHWILHFHTFYRCLA